MIGECFALSFKKRERGARLISREDAYEDHDAVSVRHALCAGHGDEGLIAGFARDKERRLACDDLGGAIALPAWGTRSSGGIHDSVTTNAMSSSPYAAFSRASISVPKSPSVLISFTSARACWRFAILPRATSSPFRNIFTRLPTVRMPET